MEIYNKDEVKLEEKKEKVLQNDNIPQQLEENPNVVEKRQETFKDSLKDIGNDDSLKEIHYNNIDFTSDLSKQVEELEYDEFDIGEMILEGTRTMYEAYIPYYNPNERVLQKKKIYLRQLSQTEWEDTDPDFNDKPRKGFRAVDKNDNKHINKQLKQSVIRKVHMSLLKPNGSQYDIEDIKKLSSAVFKEIFNQVKILNGASYDERDNVILNKVIEGF